MEAAVSITDDDAAAMLHDIADRRGKRSMANQTKHIIHAMFKWAKQPGRKLALDAFICATTRRRTTISASS